MSAAPQTPLGFSDLTADECFLVVLFRKWRRLGPTRAIAEHKLACLLQLDNVHSALDSLFRLFNELPRGTPDMESETDLLSETEEALLSLLSDRDHPDKDLALIKRCRGDIANSSIRLRPVSAIARSGRDEILIRAAESFQITYGAPR